MDNILRRAPLTWSAWTALSNAEDQSAPVRIDITRPVVLVGGLVTVATSSVASGARSPVLSDVIVQLTSNNDGQYTDQRGDEIANASGFVDAEALNTQNFRAFDIVFTDSNELIFEARWKVPALASGIYPALIGFSLWGRYLSRDEAQRLIGEQGTAR